MNSSSQKSGERKAEWRMENFKSAFQLFINNASLDRRVMFAFCLRENGDEGKEGENIYKKQKRKRKE